MEEKKKEGLTSEKRQDWIKHAFEDDQRHKNATEMLRKEFLIQIKFLQVKRKNLLNKKEKIEIDLNQKKYSRTFQKNYQKKLRFGKTN